MVPKKKLSACQCFIQFIRIFENIPYNEIVPYFEKWFSKHLTGFRKVFDEQVCLVAMLFFTFHEFRKSWDQGSEYATLPTGPWKAFDCLPHDLIIPELHAYGFDMPPLRLIHSYLPNRYQRVKTRISYSLGVLLNMEYLKVHFSALFLLMYICDMFFLTETVDIVSYVDTKTP